VIMTGRERFLAAMARRPVDRVPFDIGASVVTGGAAGGTGHPLPAQPQSRPGLSTRLDLHSLLPTQRRHVDLSSQRRLGEADRYLAQNVLPISNEQWVLANREFVDGEESFWVVYSDNLTDMDLGAMLAFHRAHDGLMTMGLFRTPAPSSAGIVDLDPSGRVVAFTEKPQNPTSDLANAGLYLARAPLLDRIPAGRPLVDFGHDVLPGLIGQMFGYPITGLYCDIGTPAALARAEADWRSLHARG